MSNEQWAITKVLKGIVERIGNINGSFSDIEIVEQVFLWGKRRFEEEIEEEGEFENIEEFFHNLQFKIDGMFLSIGEVGEGFIDKEGRIQEFEEIEEFFNSFLL